MNSSALAPIASASSVQPSISVHVAWNDVPGELVLFDTRDGSYHALNRTASQIWRGIAQGLLFRDIAQDCAVMFCVDDADAADAVACFVAEAVALGLLTSGQASE